MKRKALLTLPALAVLAAGSASAAVVTPVSITAFHQGDSAAGDGSAAKVIDGSGISKTDPADPATWTVSSTAWQDDWQGFATPAPNATWAVLDLGSSIPLLSQMYLWNVEEGGHTDRGMNGFNIYYATSPAVSPPATSETPMPYDFTSGGWTFISSENLAVGSGIGASGQSFDVSAAAGAQYIGIEITSNHGAGDRVGFGEVGFTTVPEPGSIALLLGGGLLGLLRRRR